LKHQHFLNFSEFDPSLQSPIYINFVRDPVERVISWYYYVRSFYHQVIFPSVIEFLILLFALFLVFCIYFSHRDISNQNLQLFHVSLKSHFKLRYLTIQYLDPTLVKLTRKNRLFPPDSNQTSLSL